MRVDIAMERKSQYCLELSHESQLRYQSKVVCAGLNDDPYAVEESLWTDDPDSIPTVNWSDVVLYMVSTPSPYTREELKVSVFRVYIASPSCYIMSKMLLHLHIQFYLCFFNFQAWKGMLDSENFVKSGWVQRLQLYKFTCTKFVIKGKVLLSCVFGVNA